MIAAIMQPYFFPYIGYFQLMKAVDLFVFYDDAQYMKGGWINRNQILLGEAPAWLTLPVRRASIKLPINQRAYLLNSEEMDTIRRRLQNAYAKAPYYRETFPLIDGILNFADANVAVYNENLLTVLAEKLGIRCKFVKSSELDIAPELSGEMKVIDICRHVGAKRYINSIGGIDLYDSRTFGQAGVKLNFIRPRATGYFQGQHLHVPHLSIIDVLMFNSLENSKQILNEFDVTAPSTAEQQ